MPLSYNPFYPEVYSVSQLSTSTSISQCEISPDLVSSRGPPSLGVIDMRTVTFGQFGCSGNMSGNRRFNFLVAHSDRLPTL